MLMQLQVIIAKYYQCQTYWIQKSKTIHKLITHLIIRWIKDLFYTRQYISCICYHFLSEDYVLKLKGHHSHQRAYPSWRWHFCHSSWLFISRRKINITKRIECMAFHHQLVLMPTLTWLHQVSSWSFELSSNMGQLFPSLTMPSNWWLAFSIWNWSLVKMCKMCEILPFK